MRLALRLSISPSTHPSLVLLLSRLLPATPPMASADVTSVDESAGFDRAEMFSSSLADTVDPYDRHVFLCYKSHDSWPPKIESSDEDPLPKLLASAIKSRKDDLPFKTRLTICAGSEGIDCSDGDVLIFPEMYKYRGLKETNVDSFVDDVLVSGKPWASGVPEPLAGAYVFVCAHASRDKRCGTCGPVLIEKFKEEIAARGLNEQVFATACSHVGGHKYAGNLIIFGTNAQGKVIGDWYGYVTPSDVPALLDVHIGKGEIIEKLWRGQMGLKAKETEKGEEKTTPVQSIVETTEEKQLNTETESKQDSSTGCCQGVNAVSCCREATSEVNSNVEDAKPNKASNCCAPLPEWMGKWEQSDVLMAAAVVGAVATVAVAYSIFRRSA